MKVKNYSTDANEIRLIKYHKKGLLRLIFSRLGLIIVLLAFQIAIFVTLMLWLAAGFKYYTILMGVFTTIMVFYLYNCDMDSSAKLTWMIIIAIFPIPGALFLAFTQVEIGHRALKRRMLFIMSATRNSLRQDKEVIRELIEDYELHSKRLEQVNDLIKKLCLRVKNVEKLLDIKGIGIITVAGFIAEVGDITRFDNAKELQKLAGLELVSADSGKHRGKKRISKRGRCRLRYLLFQAAISVVGKNSEFQEIHHYYTTRNENPLKKMQSLIAVACKLIRVFFAILTKGHTYDASKMLDDIKRSGSGLKAA